MPTPESAHPASEDSARLRRYLLIGTALTVLLAIWGIVSRLVARNALEREAATAAVQLVVTTRPAHGPASDSLVLPGTVQAYYEAPIYARTNGYLKKWYTDIGAHVKKGELLAQIETPEVDEQLRQAQADLATAQATNELARTTNERWQDLLKTHVVSQQDAAERASDAIAKAAAQRSAAANVARLKELESFKRVLAPFDGVVTQRNTDVGALINAGQSTGNALFRVADIQKLRIYVSVPQAYAPAIHPGLAASLTFSDRPGRTFTASVVSTARALEATTRTLQVELQIDNANGELLAGSYAQVDFTLAGTPGTLRVPVNAVLFRGPDLQVAVVGSDDRVHLKTLTAGRDFGTQIEVVTGLNGDERLIVNPPDSIADGAQVRPQPEASPESQRK